MQARGSRHPAGWRVVDPTDRQPALPGCQFPLPLTQRAPPLNLQDKAQKEAGMAPTGSGSADAAAKEEADSRSGGHTLTLLPAPASFLPPSLPWVLTAAADPHASKWSFRRLGFTLKLLGSSTVR